MTADVPELDWTLLKRITARITAEVPGICRVCYDLNKIWDKQAEENSCTATLSAMK
mgnify:CR=1 FL=1